ncbi:hypothetical protein D1AOALGA4SA_4650 [Olavius algarvensis Delta 1 endosymbiont]|nr:hypothetical protein D1AOALGA4SA_4650 [Olavius algarvensis Delta 1 endosymbiont]
MFIDPFPWSFEIKPSSIASAIRWASNNGWTPDKGMTRAMSLDDKIEKFVWLSDGQRHLYCQNKSEISDLV